ncbi:MAG: hypothetical protein JOZ81_06690 [Chloroflexi bacterium]|nr:hypothetical protein [Chloroflexota bacterium]
MTQPDYDPLAPPERTPAVSFRDAVPGTVRQLRVTEFATTAQSRDFQSGQPKFYPDGNPVKSVVIKGCDENGEMRALWAQIPSGMYAALVAAQQALGRRISPGDVLRITFTHTTPNQKDPKLNPQKQYRVEVTADDPLAGTPVGQGQYVSPWNEPPKTAGNATYTYQTQLPPQPPMPPPAAMPAPVRPQPVAPTGGGFSEPPPF